MPRAGQVWLPLPPEWARLAWAAEALAFELPLRQTLQLIASIFEARALADASLPPAQSASFPTFVWHWLLRAHGVRSHALSNLADLLLSAQRHHARHARARVFAQLAGLLGGPDTPQALALVRRAYGAAYAPHGISERLAADALVDADLAHASAAADAEAARWLPGADGPGEAEPGAAAGRRGAYSRVDARALVSLAGLPPFLEAQVQGWIGGRLAKGPAAEPLDSALGRYEARGGSAAALEPPKGARRLPTKVPALPVDELVEVLLRAHLALEREGLRRLRPLFKRRAALSGDGAMSAGEFAGLLGEAAGLPAPPRSIGADEAEGIFLDALRETRVHDHGAPEDAVSLHGWEVVAARHGLAHGLADGAGLALEPPLVERAPALHAQPAFGPDEQGEAGPAEKREPKDRRAPGAVGAAGRQ